MNESTASAAAAALHRKAEATLADRAASAPPASLATLPPEAARTLLHDLQVHQIELEMQNEELRHTQVALDAARARYFDLYDLAPVGYCTLSESGTILEANLTLATSLGVARSALVAKPFARFVLAPHADRLHHLRQRLLATGEPLSCELQMVPLASAPFWALVVMTVAPDESGPALVRLVVTDITARQQAAEAQARLAAIIESSADAIISTDLHSVVTTWNRGAEKLLGWTAAEMVGTSIRRLLPPERQTEEDHLLAAIQRGEVCAHFETVRLAKDGQRLDFSITASSIRDTAGQLVGVSNVARDITARKLAEQQQARLAAAVEEAAESVVITDTAATILYVNPAFERTSGYTRTEAIGQTPRVLKSGKHNAAFYRQMWEMLNAGQTWRGRLVNKKKDGTLYEEDGSIAPVHDAAGQIVNYVAVKRDVTHEVELESQLRQAQKMEAIGQLAGGVAHDFNNMLAVILGHAELANMRAKKAQSVDADLTQIEEAGNRAATLVRQLLAFARKQVILPRVLNLDDAVNSMLKMLRRLIGEDIALVWTPGVAPTWVNMDPSQIDQLLANLAVNARDAITGCGTVTITTDSVHLSASAAAGYEGGIPGDFVRLSVTDTGCGMDAATMRRIFEPFFTTKALGKGTGLGLATVYGIVAQNQGFIAVRSAVGQGTTFTLHLPQQPAPDTNATVTRVRAQLPTGRETILLVEDEPALLHLQRQALTSLQYRVLPAANGPAALLAAQEHQGEIHLLLSDVIMPNMNGKELYQQLLASRPQLQAIFVSGYPADVLSPTGVLTPGIHFLPKPCNLETLARKVRAVLDASA